MANETNTTVPNIPVATYDNQIRTANSNNTTETFLFGADQVFVGIENTNEQEIVTNKNTGLKYARNKVEGVEVYNLHKQAHHCWLMVDLETGGRGWYPGSKEVVDCNAGTIIYSEADDTSTIIYTTVDLETFDKLDLVYGPSSETSKNIIYCKVKYNDSVGYIKNSKIISTRYINRS